MSQTAKARTLKEMWEGDSTFATVMLTVFVDTYGTQGFEWDPETIKMEIEDDFNVQLPDANFARLMAAISVIVTDDFYQSLPEFVSTCNVLSGDTYDPRLWDPADASEVAWGVTEALLIAPPDAGDEEPFAPEIQAYIGKVLDDEGIMSPPDVLRLAVRDSAPFSMQDFTDDPEMFAAIAGFEAQKTEDITNSLRNGLQQLSTQLEALPLQNGSAQGVVQQLLRSFDASSATR